MRAFGWLGGSSEEHQMRLEHTQYTLDHLLGEFRVAREEKQKAESADMAVSVLIWWGMYVEANHTANGETSVSYKALERQVDVVAAWLKKR
jgi:hypothetical protein